MTQIKCACGRMIELKEGETQAEFFGDGNEGDKEYSRCRFCGKIFE